MNILEKLKEHDTDELSNWLSLDQASENKFTDELLLFAKENPDAIKNYCRTTLPSEFSSLTLVYPVLSGASNDWNEFLLEEVKRVIQLAKNQKINPEYIEVLDTIELERIYTEDNAVFVNMVNFMTSNLQDHNDSTFNFQLLDIIDWYLMYYEDEDNTRLFKNWMKPIIHLANGGDFKVKMKARSVIMDEESLKALKPLKFTEKIKSYFS